MTARHPYAAPPQRPDRQHWPAGQEWREWAACAFEPDLFTRTDPSEPYGPKVRERAITAARLVCAECPVLAECMADILDHETRESGPFWGVVAGMTPDERAVFTKLRKNAERST